ncbi:MAG TPA: DUF1801 domain-containing protein, partial [Gemmatimonadales bacterium]|nr:DUF1801 domain-containing protein [Gemmatimonadales bacterium]
AKPKARGTPRASKPRESKSPPKAGAEAKRANENAASRLIDERIRSLGGWRAETLAEARRLIHEADPDIVEEWKWMGTPVWSHAGNVCTGEVYQQVVKLTFVRGAFLEDPRGLFNSSLEGNTRRAIDLREGEALDAEAFKALIQAAIAENLRSSAPKSTSQPGAGAKTKPVPLLSGGNPQVTKADGDAPVQAYIAAMPGWQRAMGKRLDALIGHTVPGVRKAVKWNSPFYGIEGQGWFLGFHVFTHYVKLTFFRGTSLRPVPPGGTGRDARWINIHEDDLDEAQVATWVKQAARLPGWVPGRPS